MSLRLISLIVFIGVYVFIIFNIIPRTIIALVGVVILILFGVLTPQDMVTYVNWEALGLIFGMFVLVRTLNESGFFDFLSVIALKIAKGIPILMLFYFAMLSGFLAMFMDSITVLLFMSALSLEVSKKLKVSPLPFVLSQITAANIGGSATLMGDPPNVIFGTGLNISLAQFIKHLAPISVFILLLNTLYFVLYYKKTFLSAKPMEKSYLNNLNPQEKVKDFSLMVSTLISFLITIVLIFIHRNIGLPIGFVGLIGASLALILSGRKMEHVWESIDWEVLIFFSTLFVIIGGLVKMNIFNDLSNFLVKITSGNIGFSKSVFLWFSAILSGFVDNVPFAAAMVPLLKNFTLITTNITLVSLGLLVSFGTDVGGNFTPIGASANVVGIATLSRAGVEVSWKDYLKVVVPITFLDLLLAGFAFLIFFK
ncbi:MAG: SLC13 family permease [Caldiserica bacterium]|nr:SLC13 family permease [Caldisericota bacterium]